MSSSNRLRLVACFIVAISSFAFAAALAAFPTTPAAIPALSAPEGPGPKAPTALRCEYLDDPMGVDVAKPRFFWVLEHAERGQVQSAYQVVVSTDPKAAAGDVWDSGKIASAKSTQVVFAGKALESGRSYFWKVRVWDREGRESPWSAVASFDTGLYNKSDWKGIWIGKKNQLHKEFALKGRVKRARAYIAGLGYYELRFNGRKAGNHVLDPGWTTYNKRVLYVTYDITSFLRQGANTVAVTLGNGWYKSRALLLQVNVEFEDGTTASVVSDVMQGIKYNAIMS
jgi:alpha-L-rhamnosidase